MARFPTPPSELTLIRHAADTRGLEVLARESGVAMVTAERAVAGGGVFPLTRRALVATAERLIATPVASALSRVG